MIFWAAGTFGWVLVYLSATKMAHFPMYWFLAALYILPDSYAVGVLGVQERGSPIFPMVSYNPSPWTPKVLPNKLHRKHRGIHIHLKAARKPQQLLWVFLFGKTSASQHVFYGNQVFRTMLWMYGVVASAREDLLKTQKYLHFYRATRNQMNQSINQLTFYDCFKSIDSNA